MLGFLTGFHLIICPTWWSSRSGLSNWTFLLGPLAITKELSLKSLLLLSGARIEIVGPPSIVLCFPGVLDLLEGPIMTQKENDQLSQAREICVIMVKEVDNIKPNINQTNFWILRQHCYNCLTI